MEIYFKCRLEVLRIANWLIIIIVSTDDVLLAVQILELRQNSKFPTRQSILILQSLWGFGGISFKG